MQRDRQRSNAWRAKQNEQRGLHPEESRPLLDRGGDSESHVGMMTRSKSVVSEPEIRRSDQCRASPVCDLELFTGMSPLNPEATPFVSNDDELTPAVGGDISRTHVSDSESIISEEHVQDVSSSDDCLPPQCAYCGRRDQPVSVCTMSSCNNVDPVCSACVSDGGHVTHPTYLRIHMNDDDIG